MRRNLSEQQQQLPLIEVVELSPDLYFGRYFDRLSKVSPTAQKASNHASGLGVFCNGSSAAPIKGGFSD